MHECTLNSSCVFNQPSTVLGILGIKLLIGIFIYGNLRFLTGPFSKF